MSTHINPDLARMTPVQIMRLLHAKVQDLENQVLQSAEYHGTPLRPIDEVKADVALVMALLAAHIEDVEARLGSLETVVEVLVTDDVDEPR